MEATICELLLSVARDSFAHIFCLSGHGDALHNTALHRGVQRAREESTTCQFHHVLDRPLAERVGIADDDPAAVILPPATGAPELATAYADVHAGDWESSLMFTGYPASVRDSHQHLVDTKIGPEDLNQWRRGGDHARKVTPKGYLCDPASATPQRGHDWWTARVNATTSGILDALR